MTLEQLKKIAELIEQASCKRVECSDCPFGDDMEYPDVCKYIQNETSHDEDD